MGRPTGFEPATPRITILCSNQLSYGRRAEGKKFASPPTAVKAGFLAVSRRGVAGSEAGFFAGIGPIGDRRGGCGSARSMDVG